MPISTARYRFEFRLLEWIEKLSRSLCGERRAIFIGLRSDGAPRRMYFAPAGESFEGERKTALLEHHTAWLLYTPHTESGTGYLEWYQLEQRIAERWLSHSFEAQDFLDVRATGSRNEWPGSWRVIIG